VRAREAEEILKGKEIRDEVLEEAGKAAVKEVRLVSGAQSSIYYRRKIIHVITQQAVRQAMGLN
jgi:CO/xanthine dehydrogenase FAD-binding subunit